MKDLINAQYKYFNQGHTKSVYKRISDLKKLLQTLKFQESLFIKALEKDIGKCEFESYVCEIAMVYKEINLAIKKLRKWCKPKKVMTNIVSFPAKSYILPCPVGVVLIISPWNYPYQLSLIPLVSAIAAGNCVVLKPSEKTPAFSSLLNEVLASVFEPEHVSCVLGDKEVAERLLEYEFSHIFFTGSSKTGKEIAKKAAETLTPVTLELGGKSPCIVTETADLNLAAKRILWGKCINAGQTCVAPDYILVKSSIKNDFLAELTQEHKTLYDSQDLIFNDDYGRIIDQENYDRLKNILLNSDIYIGGRYCDETLQIEPSIIKANELSMSEEIFGPILPIIEYSSVKDALEIILENPNPLAVYVFSKNKMARDFLISSLTFGGGCINDTLIHATSTRLPFGGVKSSGIGNYHGKYGFDTFTHYKSIVRRPKLEFKSRYAPYYNETLEKIKKFI